MEIQEKVRQFIEGNLMILNDEAEFQDDDNIFKLGFVNSLFAMQLVNYVEGEFHITVDNADMNIDNFSTINNITRLVEKKMGGEAYDYIR